ncbi:MAG: DUF1775 domain-containing protein [Gemmatimonadales bacterium]|jgi:uncharacterized protein YcnI
MKSTRTIGMTIAAALVLVLPTLAFAHAVVFPKTSAPGAYERYTLRVPNERNVPVTRIELRFSPEVKVTSFADVSGWELTVERDSAQRIVGAVWTGSLAPERFVELPFVAVNPKGSTELHWPVYQTYASGERVEWTGPADAKTPASTTTIASPSSGLSGHALGIAALAIAVISLGLAVRPRTPPQAA